MADDETKAEGKGEVEEPEAEGGEGEDEQDYDAEFRTMLGDCDDMKKRMMASAASMRQRSPEAAAVLQQVAGDLVDLVQTLVAATGACAADLDERVGSIEEGEGEGDEEGEESGASFLDDDDAVDFYRTFTANLKILAEILPVIPPGEQQGMMAQLKAMNELSRERTVELCGLEESELAEAAQKPPEPDEGGDEDEDDETEE